MSETNAQEPTMEEILASIRRIISEDDQAAPAAEAAPAEPPPAAEPHPAASPPAPEEDVLELTDPVDPPQPSRPEPPKPQPAVSQSYEETLGDLDVFSTHASSPTPSAPAAPAFEHEPLVGSYAAEASAGHFGALARSVAMPKEGRTLEDVVREMLKPLLADWLDKHLSGIVEARVQAEVERISRRHDY
jgi:uncharacterized protein